MKFQPTALDGAFVIELTPVGDARGHFARTYCAREFAAHGLADTFVQSNLSVSPRKGTLRGLHFQRGAAAEDKLVRVTHGRILDVIVDLRPGSATFGRHLQVELADDDHRLLYVPRGFAHGFLTLTDGCQVNYQVSNYYNPAAEGGVRWNDPWFGIRWPVTDPILSARDAAFPDFRPPQ